MPHKSSNILRICKQFIIVRRGIGNEIQKLHCLIMVKDKWKRESKKSEIKVQKVLQKFHLMMRLVWSSVRSTLAVFEG
ncbi:hypothetical protein RND71_026546 [Anisodus tanguticus]|uniref:Uncharacterized protein n=1 Tax=Anisodus tanguticus TaxID=243964 RepID=A0AAE1V3V8_9SOLA|nr:hypothetical protein RND71_026546 [Anisodus tanguticus]